MKLKDRLTHAWNVFSSRDPTPKLPPHYYSSSTINPAKRRNTTFGDKSIINSIYTRMSVDVASMDIKHVRMDENGNFIETIKSGLNECLTIEANIDQSARAFIQDIVISLFQEGVVALVPVVTSGNPLTSSYDIFSMRTGKIKEYFPKHIRVEVWNDIAGKYEDVIVSKKQVAIVENPFYSVMNEANSTLKRLLNKISILDGLDEELGSGKLDILIQLPYTVKTDIRKSQAEQRAKDIEVQLRGNKYGIAYIDSTEKVTQLNRPTENNLLKQIESLTKSLYDQLGLTEEVFNGMAKEEIMLNYYSRTIEPILNSITEAMRRSFLTKTARSQYQNIMYFRNPFKLVPVSKLADIADKFTRNEILTSNEVRSIIAYKPSTDPGADELRNKNINQKAMPSKGENKIDETKL